MKFSRPSNEMIEKCRNDCVSYDGAEEVMSYLNRIDDLIDKEKEKLKEKINEYHFVEKIAQEPVTYKSNKYRYSKESIQYNQSDSY